MGSIVRILIGFCVIGCLTSQVFGQKTFSITTYGAVGDGKTDDAKAIQAALDACHAAGGGRVLVPAGQTFLCGPVFLKSHVELYVDVNAKLLANPDESVYTRSAFKKNLGEGTIWIGGDQVENVTIDGAGIIDGNGVSFMGAELEDSYVLKPFHIADPRPHLLTLIGGKNIRIRNLTIRNSAYWTLHLVGCDDVVISGISLLNNLKVRNSDGIDLDHSKNVRISDCYIESGDDCICLKNRREYEEFGVCENIVITNCTMTSRSCAIKIGSENMDSIRHVLVSNCVITKSNRSIGIQNRDEGTVSDVVFSNISIDAHLFSDVWWGKAEPIYVTAYRRAKVDGKDANWRFPAGATEGKVGRISGIWFNQVVCKSENGIYVSAESADKITGIHFNQVSVVLNKTTDLPGGFYDRRPSDVEGLIKAPSSGFYFDTADSITITNCRVGWGDNKASYYGYALDSRAVKHLSIEQLDGGSAFPAKLPAIRKYP